MWIRKPSQSAGRAAAVTRGLLGISTTAASLQVSNGLHCQRDPLHCHCGILHCHCDILHCQRDPLRCLHSTLHCQCGPLQGADLTMLGEVEFRTKH